MAKVKKYLRSFSTTLVLIGLSSLGLHIFFWKEAPNAWDYGFAIFTLLNFVLILVNDIIAFRMGTE